MKPVGTFVDLLDQTQILRPAQFREVADNLGPLCPDVRALGGELIRRGWLTPYQVNQLAQGKMDCLVLGPYLLVERLGQGGMGTVFKARHLFMNRLVAVKLIRPDRLHSPDAVWRFRREIQAAAQLAHPNIVRAYDAGQVGDRYFLVMEYVPGRDLAQLVMTHGRLNKAQTCDFIRQAALGLQYAHDRGVVHRDIKPGNLLLATEDQVIKILDMGLARVDWLERAGEVKSDPTRKGRLVGTKDYMAPEQVNDSTTVDIRADLYSLGCTFYHLLTGQPPFSDSSPVLKMVKHLKEEPRPIEEIRPSVSPPMAAVVRKLMAKRPEDRYQTPGALLEDLAGLS